ncbi:hypothetical protein J2W83_000546 [Pseudomonas hunanensis]|uniref:Uncharacterized protein n=1 Tax=Pseudomonas hunanensis TaxID=1247546 RepID=A0ACC6JXV2_9PSED|nr:hypothetical protein [Pseudomonas hunanensis]
MTTRGCLNWGFEGLSCWLVSASTAGRLECSQVRVEGASWIDGDGGVGACRLGAHPFDVVGFRAPSALTAGHFFSWKKVTKNRLLHHPAFRCATGSLAPVLLREDRAVRPILGLSAFRPSMASTSLRKTCARPPEVAGRSRARSRSTARATAGESLRSRFVYLPADLWCGWAGLRPAICIGSPGLFAGQARSYRYSAAFKIRAIPVGAAVRRSDLSREEARISTTHATIKNNANPDATRNFATSGGRMQEQAVFGYFFPRQKVTRRKGGRGQQRQRAQRDKPAIPKPAGQANAIQHAISPNNPRRT